MAENGSAEGQSAAPQTPQLPKMQVIGQVVRDLSFENNMVRKEMTGQVTPEVSVQFALDLKRRPTANQYELANKYNITSTNKDGGETLFVLELEYVGYFFIENVPDDKLEPFLMIEGPRMLFPFVRRLVADLTREGGFAPLNMDIPNFVALYTQTVQARAAQRQAAASTEQTPN